MADSRPVTDLYLPYTTFMKQNTDRVVDPYRPLRMERREGLALPCT